MACISKRRDRYVIDFYDKQGNRKRKTLKKGTTKTRAREILRDIEGKLAKGLYMPEERIPLFSKVAKDWLEFKKLNIRASTWSCLEGHTRTHFKELNSLRVNLITTSVVEKWITRRQQDSMNISTLRKVLVTLGQIMAYAVRHKYLDHNPVRDAERPRGQGTIEEKKIKVLTPDEIKAFLDTTTNQKYHTLFRLAIMSGARQGELLGLKWSDVDWEASQVRIERTFNHQEWYEVKTTTSKRRIDIGPGMIAELKKWKLACMPNKLNLIFPNEAGQPMNHNNLVSRQFNPALKKAGIDRIRFHDLRHTYASLLIEQGENVKYIQSQLGHSSPTVTLNVYAHLMKPAHQEAAVKLEKAIF
ncbi:MAG: site-specific integrase [Deltaproteobacteria bacterium]|nr:site-specific integrase [Deltaproteobacteria bacterium]